MTTPHPQADLLRAIAEDAAAAARAMIAPLKGGAE